MANRAGTPMKAGGRTPVSQNRKGRGPSPGRRYPASSDGRLGGSEATGNPRQRFERYTALAREAAAAGDAIEAENYYQHAEHYFRLANAKAA